MAILTIVLQLDAADVRPYEIYTPTSFPPGSGESYDPEAPLPEAPVKKSSADTTGGSTDNTGGSTDNTGGTTDNTGGSTDNTGGSTDSGGSKIDSNTTPVNN